MVALGYFSIQAALLRPSFERKAGQQRRLLDKDVIERGPLVDASWQLTLDYSVARAERRSKESLVSASAS